MYTIIEEATERNVIMKRFYILIFALCLCTMLFSCDTKEPNDKEAPATSTSESIPDSTDRTPSTTNSSLDGEGGTDESQDNTDESQNNTDESQGNTDESQDNTDESQGNTDESQDNTDESQDNTDQSQGNTDESQGNTDDSQGNTDESQGSADNDQGDTTTKKNEPIKWTEDDYYVEENISKITSVYKQWAEYFENIDTSSDGFHIYCHTETSADESDIITVDYGPSAYNMQLTSDDSVKEALDTIVVGNAWQRVLAADSNTYCYRWLAASYDLFPQYSYHYSKFYVYYFEYEDLIVKKIVKITPDGIFETGEEAKGPTRNEWTDEELLEENWQKICETYTNVVDYLRDDINPEASDFIIDRGDYPSKMRKEIYAYNQGSDVQFRIIFTRERVKPLMETVTVGTHILDVLDRDPYGRYNINGFDFLSAEQSYHFFNDRAYYIEYENGYVSKIVIITADSIAEITE